MRRPDSDEPPESPTDDAADAALATRTSPYAIPLSALLASTHVAAAEQITLQAEPSAQNVADGDGGADGE